MEEDKRMILMRENFKAFSLKVVLLFRCVHYQFFFLSVNAHFLLMPAKKTREITYHTHIKKIV